MSQPCLPYPGKPSDSSSSLPIAAIVTPIFLFISILLFGCEKQDTSIIDTLGTPPYLVSGSVSPATVNLDTLQATGATVMLTVTASVTPPGGVSRVSEVSFDVTDETGNETLTSGLLFDNGAVRDTRAGDSVYTGSVSLEVRSLLVGKYICRIVATSDLGYSSGTLLIPFTVIHQQDRPPVLSDLQAPDTIFLGTQAQEFKLMVKATDPDGQSDIAKVFFNSFKPDGSPSSGNPFLMFDDGSNVILYPPDVSSGDAVAGDGVYTLTIAINPTAATGTYRFEFQATDRSNVSSTKLVWNVEVVP